MKTKTQKTLPNKDNPKDNSKNQIKNVTKALSPKNLFTKGLTSYKSQKDLSRMLGAIDGKVNQNNQISMNNSLAQCSESSKLSIKTLKQVLPKQDLKGLNSPKVISQISPKQQGAKFFRTKNSQGQKQEEKTKKIIVQEKEEKLEELERKNQQLQIKIQILNKQRQKSQQIIEQFRVQKQTLQKHLQKLKSVSQQNKKLLKERVQGYNNHGTQLKNLRHQLQQMKVKKIEQLVEIGVNTQVQYKQNQQDQPKVLSNLELANPQKLSQSYCQTSKNSQNEQSYNDIDNQIKVAQNNRVEDYSQILNNVNFEDNAKLLLLRNIYERIIEQKNIEIKQNQQTILQQLKELNELHQRLQNRSFQPQKLINVNIDGALLASIKQNQQLRNTIRSQEDKYNMLKDQIWSRQSQIQNLKRQIMIKEIFHKNILQSYQNNESGGQKEIQEIKAQLEQAKSRNIQNQNKIKQLQIKNSQQDSIIKSLKDKKPKVILK